MVKMSQKEDKSIKCPEYGSVDLDTVYRESSSKLYNRVTTKI